jgi:hypothetical protein
MYESPSFLLLASVCAAVIDAPFIRDEFPSFSLSANNCAADYFKNGPSISEYFPSFASAVGVSTGLFECPPVVCAIFYLGGCAGSACANVGAICVNVFVILLHFSYLICLIMSYFN